MLRSKLRIPYIFLCLDYTDKKKKQDGGLMSDAHTWSLLTGIASIKLLSFPHVIGGSINMYSCNQQKLYCRAHSSCMDKITRQDGKMSH